MFAIHLVHGMHPEMFEAKVIIFAVCFCFLVIVVVVVVLMFLRPFCISFMFLFAHICMAQLNRALPLMLNEVD